MRIPTASNHSPASKRLEFQVCNVDGLTGVNNPMGKSTGGGGGKLERGRGEASLDLGGATSVNLGCRAQLVDVATAVRCCDLDAGALDAADLPDCARGARLQDFGAEVALLCIRRGVVRASVEALGRGAARHTAAGTMPKQ
jgi:hypothetical protein